MQEGGRLVLKKKVTRAATLVVILALVVMVLSSLIKYEFSFNAIWRDARIAAEALKIKYGFQFMYLLGKEKYEIYDTLWYRTDRKRSGVTVHDRELASGGLTFYSNHESSAFLVDMDGNVIHRWHKPFREVWPSPKHIISPVPDKLIYWRRAELLPNGDIIAIYEGINQAPYGGGIIKLDKDSNLVWKLDINAHHDLYVTKDGNIIVLVHSYENLGVNGNPIISDGVAIISHDGKLIKAIRILDLMKKSEYWDVFDLSKTDPFHTNNVELLPQELARNFPMFEVGDVLVSMVQPSALFVLDNADLSPKWALMGVTNRQHDPDFMSNGTIRIFDNIVRVTPDRVASRIIDVNPADNSIVWSYEGTELVPFFSGNRGSQQTLEGGNVLITESTAGRLFEITPDGQIVWEFIDPSLDGESIGVVNWATRHKRESLTFLDGP